MKGSECKFVKYMEGSDKRFVIPVYQRNYDWKTENCKQLYDDLVKIIKGHRKSHFFGSLVSVYNPDGHNEEFLIIDGQQRLTTVSLLFLAMYNLIDKGVIVPETANLKQRIFEEYLVDKWKPEDTRIKLKPVKNDQTAFGKLFSDPTEHIRESNLTVNYDYFYDRIQKQEITIDQLYDAICCLEIINIRLDMDDKGLNGHSEIALYVDTFEEVDEAYKKAVENGATSVLEPELEPWEQRTCYIADPEGNLIEIGSWNKPYEEKDLEGV